ncbi:putative uncharacterized protein [Eubacterium sp. CAG:252]|nr:putative uncharacterized protein [Eubacterium sp. CAG:252]
MKPKYRPLYIVMSAAIVLFIIFFERNVGFASFTEEMFINGCMNMVMPGAAYYCEPQKLNNDTVFDELLKTTVPVSAMLPKNNDDYIMLADNSCDYNENNADTDKAGEIMQDTTVTKDAKTDGNTGQNGSTDISAGIKQESKNTDNSTQVSAAISKKDITGTVYSRAELSDYGFVHNHFYIITSVTDLTENMLRPAEFIDKNLSIDKSDGKPKILIFHTHSQEGFTDTVDGDASTTIVGVGDYLTELLVNKYGYNVIHDTTVYDYVDGKLDRSKAYTYAENGIARILEENPTIEVVIDLHRDGVADTTHLVTEVDGKSMAKVMFFNGLSYSKVNGDIAYLYNPYRDDNLAMSLQMQLLGEAYYPGFLRRIYINAYRYCLHERGRSMLIEAGAQTNTFEEVKNAMEPLADILDKMLSGEKVIGD